MAQRDFDATTGDSIAPRAPAAARAQVEAESAVTDRRLSVGFWPQRLWFGAITAFLVAYCLSAAIRPEGAFGGAIPEGAEVPWWLRAAFALFALSALVGLGGIARARVVVKGDQMIVRNPHRTVRLPLADVERFSIGRHGHPRSLFGQAELRDGRVLPLYGIAGPSESTFPRSQAIRQNVDRLNACLEEFRRCARATAAAG